MKPVKDVLTSKPSAAYLRRLKQQQDQEDFDRLETIRTEMLQIRDKENAAIKAATRAGDDELARTLKEQRGDASSWLDHEMKEILDRLLVRDARIEHIFVTREDYDDEPYFDHLRSSARTRIRHTLEIRKEERADKTSLRRWTILGVFMAVVSTIDATIAVRHELLAAWLWLSRHL